MDQPDFFSVPVLTRTEARKQAKAAALKRELDKTSRKAQRAANAEWLAQAVDALRMFARNQSGVFSIELARLALVSAGAITVPRDLRMWGVVTTRCKDAGYIELVKYARLPAASSNDCLKNGYRKGAKA